MVGAAALFASPTPSLQSLRWIEAGKEVEAIATQPSACLTFEPRDKVMVQAGMALFNTPTLLGGQAAKADLSCASCHGNGRDNPHFLLPSLSGAAGTADVTSSFFSAARGNAAHDPARIPDLAKPGKISRARGDKTLEQFIRDLVVEEFSGNEPSPAALSTISSYVRSIGICADGENARPNRRLQDQLDLIEAALDGAAFMQQQGDAPTANLLIGSARHQLGLIHERYAAKQLTGERRLLRDASIRLAAIAEAGNDAMIVRSLQMWRKDFNRKLIPRLVAGEPYSLYTRKRITAALGSKTASTK